MNKPIAFICVFWGQSFLQGLTDFCIPSLLAPHNLPAWPYREQSRFVFYTPATEWEAFSQHPVFNQLQALLPVEWRTMDSPTTLPTPAEKQKYHFKTHYHRDALQRAGADGSATVFMIPDMFYAEDALQQLATLIAQGKELVLHIGPRVKETCLPDLQRHKQGQVIALSAEDCIDIMHEHLHPEYQGYFWFNRLMTAASPTVSMHWQADGSVEAHCYTPEPLFCLYPRPLTGQGTMDSAYLEEYADLVLNDQTEKIAVVGGNQLMGMSLAPERNETLTWLRPIPFRQRATLIYAYLKQHYTSAIYHWAFSQKVRFCGLQSRSPLSELSVWQRDQYIRSASFHPWDVPELILYIEQSFHQQKFERLLALWMNPRKRNTLVHIQDKLLWFCYYYIAMAFYALERWDDFVIFVQAQCEQLREAHYYSAEIKPSYSGYGPLPYFESALGAASPCLSSLQGKAYGIVFLDEFSFSSPETLVELTPQEHWLFLRHKTSETQLHLIQKICPNSTTLFTSELDGDALSSFIFHAQEIIMPRTFKQVYQDLVLLAVLENKSILWV